MRSLRSLCLLKVHSLGLDMSPMPPSLAKDIKIVRLFNRNFIGEVYLDYDFEFGLFVHQNAFSIQYDGASWSFLYRSNHFQADCCPHCDFVEPDIEQVTLEEGKLVPVSPHCTPVQVQMYNELMMSIKVMMEDDGTFGKFKLQLFSISDPLPAPVTAMVITVGMNADRQCEAICCSSCPILPLYHSSGWCIETPDPIQDVFSAPLYHSCIRRAMMLQQWDPEEIVGLDEVIALIDEALNQQVQEELLEDFWRNHVIVE
eukprot:GFUD01119660.1.p1 GENE.GFUD01119660.1~~GFUD01119660.1.p1  ORF type:complete len:258 (+),score=49.05 GFUD01119660.1:55-828(+)